MRAVPAFGRERAWARAYRLAQGSLVCMGRHTVTGAVCATGRQFEDWSADYRLFSKERFDVNVIFGTIRRDILDMIDKDAPLVAAMDDTGLKKTGTKIPGVAYRRDPMSPPFRPNFIRAVRALQISACVPMGEGASPAKTVPIDFINAPTPKKPRKPDEENMREYKAAKKQLNLSRQGFLRIAKLRESLDADPKGKDRPLWITADGSFTNGTVLKNLPERTTFIGRIRSDAKLFLPPPQHQSNKRGRKIWYGERALTPEQLQNDSSVPWERVKVFAAGKTHETKIKTIGPLLWRKAGPNLPIRLIVIAPLAYRPRAGSRLLYRKPAYIICSDPDAPVQKVLQAYFWRWGVEVNFRDEKQIMGIGEAQVRNPASVGLVPSFFVAAYSFLILAGIRAFGKESVKNIIPPPKWRRKNNKLSPCTQDYLTSLRNELWGAALQKSNFFNFAHTEPDDVNAQKFRPQLAPAILYAVK